MHPNIGHFFRRAGAAALGDFIFMVREDKVETTAMNIKMLTQKCFRHGRTFDMPARTTVNFDALAMHRKMCIPTGRIVTRLLPKHKIPRIFLMAFHSHARAGLLVFQFAVGKLAIIFHRCHAEQHFLAPHVPQPHRHGLYRAVSGQWRSYPQYVL